MIRFWEVLEAVFKGYLDWSEKISGRQAVIYFKWPGNFILLHRKSYRL